MASLLPTHPLPPHLILQHRSSSVFFPPQSHRLLYSTSLLGPLKLRVSVEEPVPAEEASPDAQPSIATDESTNSSLGGCKTCGRAEVERGCNGEGRMQGGIATVPGFGWWPIKAYRPCPGFVESGGRYRRQGQSMDDFSFGGLEREDSIGSTGESEKRERKGARRWKA